MLWNGDRLQAAMCNKGAGNLPGMRLINVEVQGFINSSREGDKSCGRPGGLAALTDEIWQVRHSDLGWNAEPSVEVVPKADAELGAGLGLAPTLFIL